MSKDDRPPMQQAAQVGSLLRQMTRQSELGRQLSRHQAWLIWDKLVGKQIAMRARPLRLRQGILEVQVDHPVWMQQLQMLKPQILRKLNEMIPNAGIEDIYLRQATKSSRVIPPQKKQAAETPGWLKEELSAEERADIEKALNVIKDPELKDEMRRLYMRHAQLRKHRRG